MLGNAKGYGDNTSPKDVDTEGDLIDSEIDLHGRARREEIAMKYFS